MKIGLAQINITVGDLEGNLARSVAAVEKAAGQGADLVVLPEMTVPGYPPRDILFDSSFVEAVYQATADLARQLKDLPPVIAGSLVPGDHQPYEHPGLYNAAVLLRGGEVEFLAAKRLLPGYDVFYEPRWFLPGPPSAPFELGGKKIGVIVCEDMWDEGYPVHPGAELFEAGAELLVCISASPYRRKVIDNRLHHARRQGGAMVYVNLCGATDELIFDGQSFALNAKGEVIAQLAAFEEEARVIDLDRDPGKKERVQMTEEEEVFQALSLGLREFVNKNGLKRAFLGLSGGIDSALVAAIAADAIGPENVTGVAIPSRYSDERSTSSAKQLAENLGIGFETVPLEGIHQAAEEALGGLLEGGTTAENVQARLRAMILMSFVNSHGGLLLNTSNKTELSLGYSTLYGDMAGGICPIADLTKPQVFQLAKWVNRSREIIPSFILERPPSAELKEDQVDPFDYPVISPQVEALVLANQSSAAMRISEHKRWQFGVILKVSEKAFGSGRMIPITRR